MITMTSQDNAINTQTIILLLNSHFERTERILSDMREENAEFRQEMRQEFKNFRREVNARFDRLENKAVVLQSNITALKHDVAGLYHWDYRFLWLLSIILLVFAMPQIVSGVKSLFDTVIEGLSGIIKVFRKN